METDSQESRMSFFWSREFNKWTPEITFIDFCADVHFFFLFGERVHNFHQMKIKVSSLRKIENCGSQ